jgi:hypothetical protein
VPCHAHLTPQPWTSNIPFLDLEPGVDSASMKKLDVRSLMELCTAQTPASAQGSRLKSRLRRYQRSTYVTRHSFLPWSRTRSRLNSTLARESGSDRIGEEAQALPDDARLTRVRRKRAHYFRVLSLDGVGDSDMQSIRKDCMA